MKKTSSFSFCGLVVLGSWLLFCGAAAMGQNLPTPTLNFNGITAGPLNGVPAPDVNGAVGATQYAQFESAVGSATGSQTTGNFAVWNKTTGSLVFGPYATSVLWKGFSGPCSTVPSGQTLVLYDHLSSRWIVARHIYPNNSATILCLAVSQTTDFTAHTAQGIPKWNRYSYVLTALCPTCTSNDEMDSPRMGIWPDAFYMSFNLLAAAAPHGFVSPLVCAFDRISMVAGTTASAPVCFQPPNTYESLAPSDLDGATLPPTGSPNYFMNLGASGLNVWQFHVNFTTPADSTFTGPTSVEIPPYNQACAGRGGFCIPQSPTPPVGCTPQPNCYHPALLEAWGDRLMYRLSYRNFGTYESILATHSVNPESTSAVSSSRWYEVRTPATPTLYQWGEFDPDNTSRWMGSIAQDHVGDIALGYSASSATQYPAINFTGRLATDPLGTMETEVSIIQGTGNQVVNDEWGAYTNMSIDPADDCTFWFTDQYYSVQGSKIWNTRIASFKFAGCS
jgi:hypothetical protein